MIRLGSVTEMLVGFAFKSSGFLDEASDGIRLLRGDNVQQGHIRWGEKTKKWAVTDAKALDRYRLDEGDVILAMDRPIVGGGLKMAWIRTEDLPALLVQRVCRLRGKKGMTHTDFIRYVLASPAFSAHVQRITTGANIPHISGKDIAAYEFELPPIDNQRQIVHILRSYDDLIATNQRRIALLEEAARRIYREWFVHLRFPGHESVPIKNGIPEGWQSAPYSELVAINPRTPFPTNILSPFVEMSALSETSMIINKYSMRIINGGAKFKNGDTLFARITPCTENGKTGFVQFLSDQHKVASGSTEFIVLRSTSVNPWWVYCSAREDKFREHAIRSMSGSDGRQRVNPKCFDQFSALQPPRSVLVQFQAAVEKMFTQIEALADWNGKLTQARDLLLPKLMSGQLDVSRIPAPEEAVA